MSKIVVNENVHSINSNLRYAAEDISTSLEYAKKLKDKELITKLEGIQTSIVDAHNHIKVKVNGQLG